MRRVIYLLLVATGFSIFNISCESESIVPVAIQNDLTNEILQMKAELDLEILETIKATGKPFDWNTASDDVILRAIIVTGYPIVVGYLTEGQNGRTIRNELLDLIYESEGQQAKRLGELDDILVQRNDQLGSFHVNIKEEKTIAALRKANSLEYIEMAGYPILMDEIANHFAGRKQLVVAGQARSMVLDPYQENPDYFSQVQSYSGSTATCFRRHNVDHVFRDHQIYGENIGIAVLDNGVLPEYQSFIEANGYGEREFRGYYNPLWFFPWTEPDGATPQSPDILFLSQIIEGQWLHGWQQNEDVLVGSPNAIQYSVRASPMVLILVPSQILGVINSIIAMADDPNIKIISMAMGSLFRIHQMEDAIDYYHSKDKIMVCAAGTSLPFLKNLIGVIFPATYEPVVAATGIENREEVNFNFVLGDNAHSGPEVDFCIENNSSSSGATSRFAGMLGLIWSANPTLTRDEIIDIMVQSSHFYQENGQAHFKFGWGTVDVLQAVELALEP